MSAKLQKLKGIVEEVLSGLTTKIELVRGELTLECEAQHYFALIQTLKNHPDLCFEQVSDLCGVDYSTYKNEDNPAPSFAVVVHLLSYQNNWRIRVRTFAPDNAFPVLDSIVALYNGVNWFEREAFDLFGIMFNKHPDLRRILTDYGFIGHPLRKDFPVFGDVEMKYDPVQKRIIYQPVTIEPREIIPRIVREETYGG